ncbi:MAG: anhydro-N-acetylmuramic acid kinase, partial [Rhodomicrobium sp.]|nr:anhydro-N-acetylmuramic acid kinase [Rhodomicrobium sp.]
MKAIGLMSGTSMDSVDVALIETDGYSIHSFGPVAEIPYKAVERQLLREAMVSARGINRRDDRTGVLAIAESMLTAKHAECVKTFVAENGITLSSVDVVGFHGQTVIHRPELGLTVQLGSAGCLSAAIGVPVVYDFRAADVERGGQGAPLVPIFHRALALRAKLPLPAAFVNIGGISNVTFIPE